MKKLITGISLTAGLILLLTLSFIFYGQFALDYSLENLKGALELSQVQEVTELGSRAYSSSLDSIILDEIADKNSNLESVVLLEHAARSIRESVSKKGYNQAGIYLTEVLKEKAPRRSLFLRITDSIYGFFRNVVQSVKNLGVYIARRLRMVSEEKQLEETGFLILGEADKMERSWQLKKAEQYYREFLDRYPDRPERGFVEISLAHVMIKSKRLKEASEILARVRKDFPGTGEETLAEGLMERIRLIQKRLNRIPELESWIKSSPNRLYSEEGGLELALNYLATYQLDLALNVLEKLAEAPDPRIRTKSIFYRGWINKWQGNLEEGMALFKMLEKEPWLERQLAQVVYAEIAQVHYEKKEYKQALDVYEKLSRQASGATWKALSELERTTIYAFEIGNTEAARRSLERLEEIIPGADTEFELLRKQFQEISDKGRRDEGFGALAQGRVDVAEQIFRAYLAKYPRDGTARSGMASILLLRGKLNEALEMALEGFRLERTEYTATVVGYVYEKMEKYKESEEYYRVGLHIKASYLPARFNLAWVLIQTDRFQEADALLSDLVKDKADLTTPVQAKVLNNRGCALWGMGDRKEALTHFKQALELVPDFAEAKNNVNLAAGEKPVAAII